MTAEKTDAWPCQLAVVLESPTTDGFGTTATAALLTQPSPREPYRVSHAVRMGVDTSLPALSGSRVAARDELLVPIEDWASACESILALGPSSESISLLDTSTDRFQVQLGYGYRSRERIDADKRASIEYTSEPASPAPPRSRRAAAARWSGSRCTTPRRSRRSRG